MLNHRLMEKEENAYRRSMRYHHLVRSIVLMNLIIVAGTVGFMIIEELNIFDALWLTMITVLTVGYGDAVPESGTGKLFALIIIPVAIGIVSYAMGSIASLLLEGEFSESVRLKRMKTKIQKLEDHIIVCGVGRVGEQVLEHFREKGVNAVYIDENVDQLKSIMRDEEVYLVGDATDDKMLVMAGLEKAKGVIATLPSDADNVFITLTAKGIMPDIHVVARAEKPSSVDTLRRAGADKVINPSSLGGKQMVLSMLKPVSVEYVDMMFHSSDHDFGFEEIIIKEGSTLEGTTLGEADIRAKYGVTVVAIHREANLITNPQADVQLKSGDKLVVFASDEDLTQFEHLCSGPEDR
ncbi:potassium channel family protein [Bacillus coahuilensis]|uniref:potassium channel family protein n=1 Tax=Bacillus coahuilensis TaxID=408580 RepID=UPI00018513C3|nr:potassium channel protein [Bacillus coahuilensis]